MLNIVVRGLPAGLVFFLIWAGAVHALPIAIQTTYHFLDNRAVNSTGIASGESQQFGTQCVIVNAVSCTPQNTSVVPGTTAFGTQAGFVDGQGALIQIRLGFVASDLGATHFSATRRPGQIPDGSWSLRFFNGADSAVAETPNVVGAMKIDFAREVTISGSGSAPTFSWKFPALAPGAAIDAVRVNIRETTTFAADGIAPIILSKTLPSGTTSFTVDPNDPALRRQLQGVDVNGIQHTYSIEIQLADTRNNLFTGSFPNTLSQSRTFFDLTVLPAGSPPNVFLPVLIPGAPPTFSFQHGNAVVPGTLYFYDPFVAIGYDYQIGAGDPNFAAVLLPTGIGDNLFDLYLWNGSDFFDSGIDLVGGLKFALAGAGVDRFRILGIEPSSALDPNNVTAFVTGLEFVGEGRFSGTMTPIIAAVPMPMSLFLIAVGSVAALSRRYSSSEGGPRATSTRPESRRK